MAKLKFTPNPTFELLVSVPIAGESEDEEVTFTVKYLTGKERHELFKFNVDGNETLTDYFIRLLKQIVLGWDLDKEFNEKNLDTLLDNYPQIPMIFKEKYLNECWGVAEKN